jgi:hypothetical protein
LLLENNVKLNFGLYEDFTGLAAVKGSDNPGSFKFVNEARRTRVADF